jgi:hypothetical protein
LWQETSDCSVSVNFVVDKFIVVVSAYFVKINQDDESDEELEDGELNE